MSTALENLNLEEAKSEELRAVFACIAEATSFDGGPRYSARTCRELTRVIVCRSYAKPVLEMCYFLVAGAALGQKYIDVVWGVSRATPTAFRAHLRRDGAQSDKAGIIGTKGVHYRDGDVAFEVSYGRMPFLASFIEFSISSLGFEAFDEIVSRLVEGDHSAASIVDAAKHIQKKLYAYLQDHLPPAQRQRRERHFLRYVGDTKAGGAPLDAIDDEVVLTYWRDHAEDDTVDTRTYRSVFETASKLIVALHGAVERMNASNAARIGVDVEGGEVDPEDVEYVVAMLSEGVAPADAIRQTCGEDVNFITGAEADILNELPTKTVSRQLPKSVLRNAVYGALQLRFSAGLRMTLDHLQGLLPIAGDPVYQGRLNLYQKTADRLERVTYAAVWVLFCHGQNAAIAGALRLQPDIDWGVLAEVEGDSNDSDVISFQGHAAMKRFFETEPSTRTDEVAAFLAEAKRICRRINRQGFTEPVTEQAVRVLGEVVMDVMSLVDAVRSQVQQDFIHDGWIDIEREDAVFFAAMFERLYLDQKREKSHAC